MFRQSSIQPMLVSVLTVAVFVVGITTTEAARKDPGQPGNHLTIEAVAVTLNANGEPTQLTITGDSFSFGNTLVVTLGEAAAPLDIPGASTDTEIVATILDPTLFPPGDYLLTVSTGNGQSQNDEYDLTIGAVGPAGADGQDGTNGTDGTDGTNGTNGTDGTNGTNGTDGTNGTNGTDGTDGAPGGLPVGVSGIIFARCELSDLTNVGVVRTCDVQGAAVGDAVIVSRSHPTRLDVNYWVTSANVSEANKVQIGIFGVGGTGHGDFAILVIKQ